MGIQVVKNVTQHVEEKPSRIRREFTGIAHFQLTNVSSTNRDYGASRDLSVAHELVAFLQALATFGVGRTVPSLAGTGREYMAFRYYFMTDNSVKVEVDLPDESAEVPIFAAPYGAGNKIAAVFTDVPLSLIEILA